MIRALGLRQKRIEMAGHQHLTFRQNKPRCGGRLAQSVQLVGIGFFVNAEQERRFFRNQSFSCGDIGQNHEFFNQAMRV